MLPRPDRKSTRLNSSHVEMSYAVFCLKKKRDGGRALMDEAEARPEPIPVYAEMVSINPVFLLSGALEKLAENLATGLHSFFFFNDTATTEIYTLSLHDALPI